VLIMDNLSIAQSVLEKVLTVTMSERVPDLAKAFTEAGFAVDAEAGKVTAASQDPGCFEALAANLASSMPSAMICTRQVLARHNIQI
jgi:hypothetical protein